MQVFKRRSAAGCGGRAATLTWEALELVAARFRAMGEPLRLHMLQELEGGEQSVSALR